MTQTVVRSSLLAETIDAAEAAHTHLKFVKAVVRVKDLRKPSVQGVPTSVRDIVSSFRNPGKLSEKGYPTWMSITLTLWGTDAEVVGDSIREHSLRRKANGDEIEHEMIIAFLTDDLFTKEYENRTTGEMKQLIQTRQMFFFTDLGTIIHAKDMHNPPTEEDVTGGPGPEEEPEEI